LETAALAVAGSSAGIQGLIRVPDSRQQLVRYYETFSNARRVSPEAPASASAHPADPQPRRQHDADNGEVFARARRRSWARLIKKKNMR